MAEAKARELLALCGFRLAAQLTPVGAIEPSGLLDQLLTLDRILLPPLVVGHRTPVAQQIGVPVLAAADAAVARLESTDASFHLIVGAREALPVVALHQVRPQVGKLLQELGEALLLQLAKRAVGQLS